ncbi:Feline leukemia virus subgroup C receptor- protein 2 [Entomophthora muscae]|uniref:Feline leukemia virus subgroup C receptor-protein 2 n=1 Tax=Entomophthora muscae TaxID=34485 RepID=A0ACC2UPZ8_9FUNG|nr:Feline leukemia virus subgroup C receptor- protein 2 [Entomophthora muscae]
MDSHNEQGLQSNPILEMNAKEFTVDEEISLDETDASTIQYDPRRWAVLCAFNLVTFSSNLAWLTFAPSANRFSEYYEMASHFYVDSLSTVYMLTYPVFLLPALTVSSYFYKRELSKNGSSLDASEAGSTEKTKSIGYGLRGTLITAILLHASGCWLRFLGGKIFPLVWLGQALASLCQVFTLGMPPLLSSVWFKPDEQNIAISLGVTSNILGCTVGFLLTPFAVGAVDLDKTIPAYLLYQAVGYSVLALAIILLFPTAPRMSQRKPIQIDFSKETTLFVLRKLSKTPGFLLLATCYGLLVGSQYAVQTLLTSIILPVFVDKSEVEIGWLGFWLLISGILASLICGLYLDYSKRYISFTLICYSITILSLLSMNVALEKEAYLIIYISSLVYGMATVSLTPALFQYAMVYFNKRDDEAAITGILNSMAQIVGIVLISSMSAIQADKVSSEPQFTMRVPAWLLVAVTCLGLPLLLISQKKMS